MQHARPPPLPATPSPRAPPAVQRVRALQHLLGGFNYTGDDVYAPVFLPPGRPLTIADVMSGLRDHYAGVVEGGTPRDPYQEQTPAPMLFGNDTEEPWRPVAMLTTGLAHGALFYLGVTGCGGWVGGKWRLQALAGWQASGCLPGWHPAPPHI